MNAKELDNIRRYWDQPKFAGYMAKHDISALLTEIDKLREALEAIAAEDNWCCPGCDQPARIAKAALAQAEKPA